MIPEEVKLALCRIALFCKEHECSECPIYNICCEYPDRWEKMLVENN